MKNTLETLFKSFETGIRSSKAIKPKEYLKNIGLDYAELRIGFNSAQFHHRETQEFKNDFEALGMLKKSDAGVRKEDLTAYSVFGRDGLIFPLVDKENRIVNYFALRFKLETPKEEYLNDTLKKIIEQTSSYELIQKDITLHCLRHSIASHLMEKNAGIDFIRGFLGHSQINTTYIYAVKNKRRKPVTTFKPSAYD